MKGRVLFAFFCLFWVGDEEKNSEMNRRWVTMPPTRKWLLTFDFKQIIIAINEYEIVPSVLQGTHCYVLTLKFWSFVTVRTNFYSWHKSGHGSRD